MNGWKLGTFSSRQSKFFGCSFRPFPRLLRFVPSNSDGIGMAAKSPLGDGEGAFGISFGIHSTAWTKINPASEALKHTAWDTRSALSLSEQVYYGTASRGPFPGASVHQFRVLRTYIQVLVMYLRNVPSFSPKRTFLLSIPSR